MGMKHTVIAQPHVSTPSQEASHAHNSPAKPLNPPDLRSSPSPSAPPDQPQPPVVDSRPSMDVKTLIQFFNSRSTNPSTKPSAVTRQPFYNLNGKVKNLVREFSKSTQSLLDPRPPRLSRQVRKAPRTVHSEPAIDHPRNGGDPSGNGVFQASRGSRQVSEKGSSSGYVTSLQHTDPPKQPIPNDHSKQQHQEPTPADVGVVQGVTRMVSRPTKTGHNSGWEQAESIRSVTPTSTASYSETLRIKGLNHHMSATPIRLDDMLSRSNSPAVVSQEQSRPDPIDSVVMSARNSQLRKTRSMGLVSSGIERYESAVLPLGLETVEEQLVPRTPNKSTEPPPLKIVKARKSGPASYPGFNTFGCYEEQTAAPPKAPFLAPPAQRFVEPQEFARSSKTSSVSDSVSIPPERSISYRQSAGSLTKKSWQNRRREGKLKRDEDSQASRSMHLITPSIVLEPLDGFSGSPTSWTTPTPSEDTPSVAGSTALIHSPLSPPRASFRSYILSPSDTAGKYHSLRGRKIELIRPLSHPFFAEQIGLQQLNPRFSTFTKQEGFSDTSLVTIDQEVLSVGSEVASKLPAKAKDLRRLDWVYKSPPIQKVIAREDATSRAAGLMSPSYVLAGLLSRALSRANSVDMENKRYSSRRRQ